MRTERTCVTPGCGNTYVGTTKMCEPCRRPQRTCANDGCARRYRGFNLVCNPCSRAERTCGCGRVFTGHMTRCWSCNTKERICATPGCGQVFTDNHQVCYPCRRDAVPEEARRAQWVATSNARRARQAGAAIDGPVSRAEYEALRSGQQCVYCDAPATTVDHIVPLALGGIEHEANLVPACAGCNFSKSNTPLMQWHPGRAAHAAAKNPKVAAVLDGRYLGLKVSVAFV